MTGPDPARMDAAVANEGGTMAIRIVCRDCGSEDVARDAWASWDVERQEWVLGAVLDDGHCHRCEAPAKLVEQLVLAVV